MKGKELQRVKTALLKELDVTLQQYCRQGLQDIMTDLRIRYTNSEPDSSPDEIISAVLQSGVLKTISAPPMVHVRESLERLRLGTFGSCVLCGKEISSTHLEKNPTATYCTSCEHESQKLMHPARW
jgi:RNA polymerase-binding transcription factor DksA